MFNTTFFDFYILLRKDMLTMNNIKNARTQKNLTQNELADKVGSTRQTIAKWEKGNDNGICLDTIKCMCEIFNCEIGYLVGDYDTPQKETTDIHNKTGLSEKAIYSIISDTKARPFIETINTILTLPQGILFLNLLTEYILSYENTSKEDAIKMIEIQNSLSEIKKECKKKAKNSHKKLF